MVHDNCNGFEDYLGLGSKRGDDDDDDDGHDGDGNVDNDDNDAD